MFKKLVDKIKLTNMRKYEDLIKERFNVSKISIDVEDEPGFFNSLLEIIKEQYKCEIDEKAEDDDEAKIYMQNEKVRLEIKIKELEMNETGPRYVGNLLTVILTVVTLTIGNAVGIFTNMLMPLINYVLNSSDITSDTKSELLDAFKNTSIEINSIVMKIMIIVMIILSLMIIALEVLDRRDINNLCVKRTFNRYCLQALKNVKEDEPKSIEIH